jgi:hypothetical protein
VPGIAAALLVNAVDVVVDDTVDVVVVVDAFGTMTLSLVTWPGDALK